VYLATLLGSYCYDGLITILRWPVADTIHWLPSDILISMHVRAGLGGSLTFDDRHLTANSLTELYVAAGCMSPFICGSWGNHVHVMLVTPRTSLLFYMHTIIHFQASGCHPAGVGT